MTNRRVSLPSATRPSANVPPRKFLTVLAIASASWVLGGCSDDANEAPGASLAIDASTRVGAPAVDDLLPRGFKGYELYSWGDQGDVCFTLITGTNRLKTRSELQGPNAVVDGMVVLTGCGIGALEATLARLPRGEQVSVVGGSEVINDAPELPTLRFLAPDVIARIRQICENIGLEFFAP
jgi:hypothetical protein